jgi:hypothetical protein
MVVTLFAAAVSAGEWENLTEEQRQKLLNGEVIYQSIKNVDERGALKGSGQSMVLVNAPIDKCWEIFTQFNKQQEYWPRKTGSGVLEQGPGFALVLKQFKFAGAKVSYVVKYLIDEENHSIDYEIDKSRPHDIKDAAGSFCFEKIDSDTTLFIYQVTRMDTGIFVPEFIREALQKRDLPAVAENVKKRIESGGTWKKN